METHTFSSLTYCINTMSNGMQWLPVVCCQFLLVTLLYLCRFIKVSYKFILCRHTHEHTFISSNASYFSSPLPLSRKEGQMLQVVQHTKSSHTLTHTSSSLQVVLARVGGDWIQPPASQRQSHIQRDLSKCKSAAFIQQHT